MWLCLAHPTEGYYTKPLHEVLGARGDFITSPEISQVFGEVFVLLSIIAQGGDERIAIAYCNLASFSMVGEWQSWPRAHS